jgi:multiple sugar transport system ATP-binding protein
VEVEERYVGTPVILGIRPQKISFFPQKREDKLVPSLVEVIEPLGESKILTVKLDDSELKIATSVETEAEVGKTIWLEFRPEDIHIFDKETEDTLTKKLEGKE